MSATSEGSSPAFADALRSWRRRRGVSQLELALRAGTTQRHVSFLEGARSLPGRGMVIRLGEALEIPLRQRNALLLAAGYAPVYAESRPDDPHLDPVRGALERVLQAHLPYPAVLTDRHATLVSANAAFTTLVRDVAPPLRATPVNVARLLLHPEGLAPRIVNLATWGRHVTEALRRSARRSGAPELERLAAELEPLLPERTRSTSPDDLGLAVPLVLREPDGGELRLLTTLTHFATATDVAVDELTLEAFLPADVDTAARLSEHADERPLGSRSSRPTGSEAPRAHRSRPPGRGRSGSGPPGAAPGRA